MPRILSFAEKQLRPSDVLGAVNHLPLQVTEVHHIEIDEPDAANSSR
jgi:hypothetical protein